MWANSENLKECKKELKEVLEEWLILKIRDGDNIPGLSFKLILINLKNTLTKSYAY